MPKKPSDLELATNDELVGELMNRFDRAVFCGVVQRHEKHDYQVRCWRGEFLSCIGLSMSLQRKLLDEMDASYTETDD